MLIDADLNYDFQVYLEKIWVEHRQDSARNNLSRSHFDQVYSKKQHVYTVYSQVF